MLNLLTIISRLLLFTLSTAQHPGDACTGNVAYCVLHSPINL
jgi:hypothetical protein